MKTPDIWSNRADGDDIWGAGSLADGPNLWTVSPADGDDLSAAERRFWRSMERSDVGSNHDAYLRQLERLAGHLERKAKRCGARTKQPDHHPCRNLPEPGRTRCKYHGGMSTGPRTVEGRAGIAEAQRKRWAAWRERRNRDESPQAGP